MVKFSDYLNLPNSAFWHTQWHSCAACCDYFTEDELTRLQGSEALPYTLDGFVCVDCHAKALTFYYATCPICGVVGHRRGNFRSVGLFDVCPMCHEQYLWRPDEQNRVSTQRARARKLGLADTLTIIEWVQTTLDFDKKCAYCGGPYQAMDHFIPVCQGGGTTATNCVPACIACNFAKDAPNEQRARRVSSEKRHAIASYLATWTLRVPVTTARVGLAFPTLARYRAEEAPADNPFVDRLEALLGL